jgi:cytochrome c
MKKILLAFALIAAPSAAFAQAAPNPVLGKAQFGQCTICHDATKGGPDKIGPNLWGVVGAKAGQHRPKFAYSPQLKASGLTWDAATLDRWIKSPGEVVKGTKMEFIGIGRKATRDNIIAYLATLK